MNKISDKKNEYFFTALRTRLTAVARAIAGKNRIMVQWGSSTATDMRGNIYMVPSNEIEPGVSCKLPELILSYKGKASHEGGHEKFTSYEIWQQACKRGPVIRTLVNIIEDGRIEAAVAYENEGAGRWLRFNNQYIYKNRPPERYGNGGQQTFLMGLVVYSVLKVVPPFLPEETRELIKLAAPYVDIGRAAPNTEVVLEMAEAINAIPEIQELFKNPVTMPPSPDHQGSKKPSDSEASEDNKQRAKKAVVIISKRQSTKDINSNENNSLFTSDNVDDSPNKEKSSRSTNESSSKEDSSDNEDDSNEGSNENSDSDENSGEDEVSNEDLSNGGSSPEESDENDSGAEENSSDENSDSEDSDKNDSDEDIDSSPNDSDENSLDTSELDTSELDTSGSEDSNSDSDEDSENEADFDSDDDSDDDWDSDEDFDFEEEFEEEDFSETLDNASEELATLQQEAQRLQDESKPLDYTEGIKQNHSFKIIEPSKIGDVSYEEIKRRHNPAIASLTKSIQVVLEMKKDAEIRNLQKGKHIPSRSLYKVGMGDINVFAKNKKPGDTPTTAFYILVDNSGSMGHEEEISPGVFMHRYEAARDAACIISEVARKLNIPHAITGFTASGSCTTHIPFVRFSDTSSEKLTFLYPDYRNRDGFSIRVATNELMARPEEKKILFVLSDGTPSAYRGGFSEGIEDTRLAAFEAKKKGIKVISLFFGYEEDRADFNRMYEHPVYIKKLSDLPRTLGEIFKRVYVY